MAERRRERQACVWRSSGGRRQMANYRDRAVCGRRPARDLRNAQPAFCGRREEALEGAAAALPDAESGSRDCNCASGRPARALGCADVCGLRTWEQGRPAFNAYARRRPLEGKTPSFPGRPVPLHDMSRVPSRLAHARVGVYGLYGSVGTCTVSARFPRGCCAARVRACTVFTRIPERHQNT